MSSIHASSDFDKKFPDMNVMLSQHATASLPLSTSSVLTLSTARSRKKNKKNVLQLIEAFESLMSSPWRERDRPRRQ